MSTSVAVLVPCHYIQPPLGGIYNALNTVSGVGVICNMIRKGTLPSNTVIPLVANLYKVNQIDKRPIALNVREYLAQQDELKRCHIIASPSSNGSLDIEVKTAIEVVNNRYRDLRFYFISDADHMWRVKLCWQAFGNKQFPVSFIISGWRLSYFHRYFREPFARMIYSFKYRRKILEKHQ